MKWTVIGDVVVHCSNSGEISNDIWQQFLQDLRKHRITKSLGLSLGTQSVTSVQRKEASEIAKAQNITTAVVTDDGVVRGVLTALSWLGANVKSFSWNEVDKAIKYLKLDPDLEYQVSAAATSLRQDFERELGTWR